MRLPDSVVLAEHSENFVQAGGEFGQLAGSCGVEYFKVDRPVAVNYPVPQPGGLLPRNIREPLLDLGGQLARGFTQYREIPEQCVPALAVIL